jgi:pimeloyl-ACP methyl ester carboxylesterase
MARATVVLLPGLLCDATVWVSQRSAMPDAQCIVPDYGLLNSIPAMARQVLDQVPADPLCVVGHSMGGRVALEMARLAPQRIERLALLDTGTQARPADAVGLAEEQQRLELVQLAREKGMREMGRRWARGMVHPAQIDTPLFETILDMIERKTVAAYEAQIAALLGRPDARSVLESLQCPTLLLCGRQDQWSPLARHQQMHAALPGSKLVVVEDAGHMTTMEQPAAVNAALQQWLAA